MGIPIVSSATKEWCDIPWYTTVKCGGTPITNRCCYQSFIGIVLVLYIISTVCSFVIPTSTWLIIEHLGGNTTEIDQMIMANITVPRYEQKEYLLDYTRIGPLCTNVAVGSKTIYRRYGPDTQDTVYQKECSVVPVNTTVFPLSSVPSVDNAEGKQITLTLVIVAILSNIVTLGLIIPLLQCPSRGILGFSCSCIRSERSTCLWSTSIILSILSIVLLFAAVTNYKTYILVPTEEAFEAADDVIRWQTYKTTYPKVNDTFRYTLTTLWYRIGDGYTITIISAVFTILAALLSLFAGFLGRKWLLFRHYATTITDNN